MDKHPFVQKLLSNKLKLTPRLVILQPRRSDTSPVIQQLWTPHYVQQPHGWIWEYKAICGKSVDEARNELFQYAIQSGAKYALCVDDDVALPFDGLNNLLFTAETYQYPVVSGVYYQRCFEKPRPFFNNLQTKNDKHYIITPDLSPADELENCNRLAGLGCMLIRVDVLKELSNKYKDLPLCFFVKKNNKIDIGEDFVFTQRLIDAGFTVAIDRKVHCLHVDMSNGDYWCHPGLNNEDIKDYYYTTRLLKQRNPRKSKETRTF